MEVKKENHKPTESEVQSACEKKNCPSCNAVNDNDANYCEMCGTKMVV